MVTTIIFWAIVVVLLAASLLSDRKKTGAALKKAGKAFFKILPQFLGIRDRRLVHHEDPAGDVRVRQQGGPLHPDAHPGGPAWDHAYRVASGALHEEGGQAQDTGKGERGLTGRSMALSKHRQLRLHGRHFQPTAKVGKDRVFRARGHIQDAGSDEPVFHECPVLAVLDQADASQ
jgi:hypothetical protein